MNTVNETDIALNSAILYNALHPLFTSNLKVPSGSSQTSSLNDVSSTGLLRIIAKSASVMIDRFARLNDEDRIMSFWLTAEQVLEAGAVWASSFMTDSRGRTAAGDHGGISSSNGMREAMGPILKVSALLASFAARWKAGSAYVDTWEAFVELFCNML